jgi:hypothetical protein
MLPKEPSEPLRTTLFPLHSLLRRLAFSAIRMGSATDNLDSESTTLFAYPPSLSAYASLFGNFDFNRTALAPPGTKVVAHVSADTRTSHFWRTRQGWLVRWTLT